MNTKTFDASFVCSTCHQKGFPCQCVSTCPKCGTIYNNTRAKSCEHRVHEFDVQIENAFKAGYWRIDDLSGRLYKTRAGTIQHIYQELDKGNVFFSRQEFKELIKAH